MSLPAAHFQQALVQHLRATEALTDPAVAEAFLAVGRHHFLPHLSLEAAYADEAIATKYAGDTAISSSSQPAIMAIMLEQLELAPGQRVLEIGAGTGYNAALLGHLVGPTGRVITIDFDEDLVLGARQHLAAAGVQNVEVVQGDGAFGWAAAAPYDRVILTVGAWEIAPAWHAQLKPGGRLVLPLELGHGPQKSLALVRPLDPAAPLWFESVSARDCGFMELRGAFASPNALTTLGPEPGLHLSTVGALSVPADEVYAWLTLPWAVVGLGMPVNAREIWEGLGVWLGLHTANLCRLSASNGLAERGLVPCLLEFGRQTRTCLTLGMIGPEGLALLGRGGASQPGAADDDEGRRPFELLIHTYGPGGSALVEPLRNLVLGWMAAGRPGASGLRVRVYPRDHPYAPLPGEIVSTKRHTQLVVDWVAGRE